MAVGRAIWMCVGTPHQAEFEGASTSCCYIGLVCLRHVKKQLCKRYTLKMSITGKLTEENLMIPKNPKRCEMKKLEVLLVSVPLTVLVKELDPLDEVAYGRTTTET